jgi:hypothetical protein
MYAGNPGSGYRWLPAPKSGPGLCRKGALAVVKSKTELAGIPALDEDGGQPSSFL